MCGGDARKWVRVFVDMWVFDVMAAVALWPCSPASRSVA